MEVDLLIFQMAVIFLPGIIWARLDARFAAKEKLSNVDFVLNAFVFGVATYAVEFLIYAAFRWPFKMADFGNASSQEIVTKDVVIEILWALVIGIILSLVWLFASNHKWLSRFLQKFRFTKKYGDEDVWDFTSNSSDVETEYVHFRDFEHQLVYAGWVNAFSETNKLRELVLRDVIVYNFDGEEFYRTPLLYLARAPENIHIEFPPAKAETAEKTDD